MTTAIMPTQFELKQAAYASDIKSRALNVLIYLIDRTNKQLTCFPSIATIGKNLHISISTVKRAMKELVEKGFLKKEARFLDKKNGGQTSNLYFLSIPEEKTEAPEDTAPTTPCDTPTEEQPKHTEVEIKHISFDTILADKKAVELVSEQTQGESDHTDTAEFQQDTEQEQQTVQLKASTFKAVILSRTQAIKHTFFKLKSFIYPKLNPTSVQSDTPLNLSREVYNSDKKV